MALKMFENNCQLFEVFSSYLSDDDMISAANFKFRDAIISPSALMT